MFVSHLCMSVALAALPQTVGQNLEVVCIWEKGKKRIARLIILYKFILSPS